MPKELNKRRTEEEKQLLKDVGADCRYIRQKCLRMSQKEFAEKVGKNQSLISMFERGLVDSLSIAHLYGWL